MSSTMKDFIVGVSQADCEHSTIGCEVVHCYDMVVIHITLYHIFQDLLMSTLQPNVLLYITEDKDSPYKSILCIYVVGSLSFKVQTEFKLGTDGRGWKNIIGNEVAAVRVG